MQSKAATVDQYLSELPDDRRQAIRAVRQVIRDNLPAGYREGMQYGMIGYFVPHDLYPEGYHCDPKEPLCFVGLASQKNHMALYMMCQYVQGKGEKGFRAAWAKTGKKLDMGKSCIRFKRVEDLALDLIGQVIRDTPVEKHIEFYETTMKSLRKKRSAKGEQAPTRKPARGPRAKRAPGKAASRQRASW
jgi:uncharacterized protein YdhG (YjbR/CyaY superfamily)